MVAPRRSASLAAAAVGLSAAKRSLAQAQRRAQSQRHHDVFVGPSGAVAGSSAAREETPHAALVDGIGPGGTFSGASVFVVCRHGTPMGRANGIWQDFGGRRKRGETPYATAFREMQEEIVLTAAHVDITHDKPTPGRCMQGTDMLRASPPCRKRAEFAPTGAWAPLLRPSSTSIAATSSTSPTSSPTTSTATMVHQRTKTREVFDLACSAYLGLRRAAHRAEAAADAAALADSDDDADDVGPPPPPPQPRQQPASRSTPPAAPPACDAAGAGNDATAPSAAQAANDAAGAVGGALTQHAPPPQLHPPRHEPAPTHNAPRTAQPALGCVSHLLVRWLDRQCAGGNAANLVAAPTKAAALASADRNVRPPALSSGLSAIDGVFHEVCAGNGTLSHCAAHHGLAAGTLSETDGPKAAALPLAFPAPARFVGDAMSHDWIRDPALAVGGGTPFQPVAFSWHGIALDDPSAVVTVHALARAAALSGDISADMENHADVLTVADGAVRDEIVAFFGARRRPHDGRRTHAVVRRLARHASM